MPVGCARALLCTMSKTLSPAQASKLSGISRWTIVRAIQSGHIDALRDNRNHWKINQKSFDDWCNARGAHSEHAHPDAQPNEQVNVAQSVKIAELEVETRMLKEKVSELQVDRDAWRRMAEKNRQGFFSRIFQAKD